MPFCPKCKYEYREEIKVCPDCDLPLKAHLHDDSGEEPKYTEEPLVTLLRTGERIEAEIIKGILDSAGIPNMIQSDVSTATRAAVILPNRGISIIVQESRLQDAMQALQQAQQDSRETN